MKSVLYIKKPVQLINSRTNDYDRENDNELRIFINEINKLI